MADQRAIEAGLHEGGHSGSAALLSIPILSIRRSTSYEACTTISTNGLEHLDNVGLRDEGIRRCAAIITPFVMGCVGTADDIVQFGKIGQAGVPLQRAYALALELVATDEHSELRWLVVDALMRHPVIAFERAVVGPDELRAVLRRYR